ncbi:hypothetical protein PybrP1_006636 [[Pythium] brassicae (nom. inval.)]|nr:hypothetical protein PybrP1_006636 [[Pythium] brassicae (nom. inval.)]
MAPKVKLLVQHGVDAVRGLHVLVHARERDVEVQVECEDHAREQRDKDRERRVLKVRELDLHGPELGAPANVRRRGAVRARGRGRRRRLPAHSLPVGRLDVLKVVRFARVVEVQALLVDHERVPDEQVRNVQREQPVDAACSQRRERRLVVRHVDVVVLVGRRVRVRAVLVVANVRRDALVAGLGQPLDAATRHLGVLGARVRVGRRRRDTELLRRAVVHGRGDRGPAHVRVREAALEDRRRRGEREQDRREHAEVVVQVARLANVLRLERHLEAAHAHAERHAVHVDETRVRLGLLDAVRDRDLAPRRQRRVVRERVERLGRWRLGQRGAGVTAVRGRRRALVCAGRRALVVRERALGLVLGAGLFGVPRRLLLEQHRLGVHVLEERHADVHLARAALADVARERREARVRVDHRVAHVARERDRPERLGGRDRKVLDAHHRERRDGRRDLVLVQQLEQARAAQAHVRLDLAQVAREAAVRHARRALDHPRAVLGHPRAATALRIAARVLGLLRLQLREDLGAAQRQPRHARARVELEHAVLEFVAPLEHVALNVLDAAVRVEELVDAVRAHVGEPVERVVPVERRALDKQPHGVPAAT